MLKICVASDPVSSSPSVLFKLTFPSETPESARRAFDVVGPSSSKSSNKLFWSMNMPNEKKPLHTICKCAPGVICVCDRRSHDGERMSDTRGGGAPAVVVVLVLALVVVPLVVPFAVVDEGPPRGCSRPPDMIDAAQRCRSPKVGRTDGGSRGVRFKR